MTVVVDTNVIAYLLLRTEPFYEEVASFWAAGHETEAPASWEAEVTNVLWLAVRAGVVERDAAVERLALAGRLGIRSVPVRRLWRGGLVRACIAGHPAYDTLFVELAVDREAPLVTFDKQLLSRFPTVACRPSSLG